jgi:hypothetical protein
MLQCTSNPARTKALAQLCLTSRERQRLPKTILVFLDFIEQWMQDPKNILSRDAIQNPELVNFLDTTASPDYSTKLQTAISEQTAIGWQNAIRGIHKSNMDNTIFPRIPGWPTYSARQQPGSHQFFSAMNAVKSMVDDIWRGRNDVVHRRNRDTEAQIQHSKMLKLLHISTTTLCSPAMNTIY